MQIQALVDKLAPFADKTAELTSGGWAIGSCLVFYCSALTRVSVGCAGEHQLVQSVQTELLSLQKDIRKHAPNHDNKNNISKHMKACPVVHVSDTNVVLRGF